MLPRTFPAYTLALSVIAFSSQAARSFADVSLPALFSNHMVLQAGPVVQIWGWASPTEQVSVSWADETRSTRADSEGQWRLKLETLKAGDRGNLTVRGRNLITIEDAIVGEVWLCAGQSNMAFGVGGQETKPTNIPLLRVFTEESQGAADPQKNCKGSWILCSPDTLKQFSGTAYFFGKNLHDALQQPVGLIVSAVGGTRIEAWTSAENQRALPELKPQFDALAQKMATYDPVSAKAAKEKQLANFQELVEKARAAGVRPPKPPSSQYDPRASGPGNLFNSKIAPLIPYTIRGAIWYQGEANAQSVSDATLYAKQLPLLITDWRTRWGQGDFPFAWVQLPKFHDPKFQGWREMRESMMHSLKVPKSGMAVMVDTGDPEKIHPNNKKETGRRLSLWALAKVYGRNIPHSGPIPSKYAVRDGMIEVWFQHAYGGLAARNGGPLKGFEVAGEDGVWHAADARIDGDTIRVLCADVPLPKMVRYAWEDAPDCNLVNGADLPASPFRAAPGASKYP